MSELCIGNMIPGPRGRDGLDGINGIDGLNAYTVTDASFVMPAVLATVDVTVVENGWAMVGQTVFIEGAGFFTVTAKAGTTTLTLSNSGDTGNAAPTTVIPAASGMSPGGVQGVDGNLSGPAGGDLTGTYPNPTVDLLKITSAKMSVTGVTAGFYGSSTQIPGFGVDVAGRITSVTLFSFSASPTGPAGGDLTGFYPNPTLLVVPAIKGGTGQSVVDIGDILYGSAPNVWSRLPDVAVGNALISGGVGVAPSWGKIDLAIHVTNALPATNGGTGTSVVATGDLLYGSAPNTWSRLADVVVGNVLQSGGIGVPPFWGPVVTSSTGVAPGSPNQILATNLAATASEWRTIAGTSNQISVAFLAGSVTLSTPQNIHTGASPTFVNVTLSSFTEGTPLLGSGGALTQDANPAAHRLYGWNNTTGDMQWITMGSGLVFDDATNILTSTGGGGGGVTSVAATAPVAGFTISGSPITTSGTFAFTLADDLAALEALTTSGVAQRTGTSTWATTLGTADRLVTWSATAPYLTALANLATYIAGTANQVLVTDDGDGTITLSTPQNISVGASPTFVGATFSGLTALRWVATTALKALSTPALGPYDMLGVDGAGTGGVAVTLAGTTNQISINPGAATGDRIATFSLPQNIHTGASPSFTGLSISSNASVLGLLTATGVQASALNLPLLTPDALFALDAVNTVVSITIGAGLTYNPGTNTLSASGGGGTVTSITLTQPAAGFTITGSGVAITSTGTPTFALADDLAALEALTTTGFARRTALDTWSTLATIDVAGGGTGVTTLADAGVLIGNGTSAVQVTSAGTAGQVLTSNGAGVDPTFQALPGGGGGTVTSITLTQPAAGFTITGSGVAITTTGTPTFALADDLLAVEGIATTGWVRRTASNTWSTLTTIDVAGGGTGATTFTDAGVLIGNGTSAVQVTSAGTAGQILTSNGPGVDPTFQVNAGTGVPAPSDTYIQYNAGGFFGADSGLTWIVGTYDLKVGTAGSPGDIWLGNQPFARTATDYTSTFVGPTAGGTVFTGTLNTGVGGSALAVLTSGGENVAVGYIALNLVTSGSRNVAVGAGSGGPVTTGGYNVCLGNAAQVSGATATNQIVIGGRGTSAAGATSVVGVGDNTCTIGGVSTAGCVLNLNAGKAPTTRATVGGTIEVDTTDVSSSTSATPVKLVDYELDSDTLGRNGDRLILRVSGTLVNNTNAKNIRILFNGFQLASGWAVPTTGTQNTSWEFFVEILRLSDTSIRYHLIYGGNITPLVSVYSTLTSGFSLALDIPVIVEAAQAIANGDIIKKTFSLEWHPAPV